MSDFERYFAGCPGFAELRGCWTHVEFLEFARRVERRITENSIAFPQRWRDAEVRVQLDQMRLQREDVRHLYVYRHSWPRWDRRDVLVVASMNALDTDDREMGRAAAEGYQALFDECGDGKASEGPVLMGTAPSFVGFAEAIRMQGLADDLMRQGHVVVEGMTSATYQAARQEYEQRYYQSVNVRADGVDVAWHGPTRRTGRTTYACHDCASLLRTVEVGATIGWFIPTMRWLDHIRPMLSQILFDYGWFVHRWPRRDVLECDGRRVAFFSERERAQGRCITQWVDDQGEARDNVRFSGVPVWGNGEPVRYNTQASRFRLGLERPGGRFDFREGASGVSWGPHRPRPPGDLQSSFAEASRRWDLREEERNNAPNCATP